MIVKDKSEIQKLWAKTKPRKSLLAHMIESGCIAQVLVQTLLYKPIANLVATTFCITLQEAIAFLAFYVALHDIGKCRNEFQFKDPSFSLQGEKRSFASSEFRHERASFFIMQRILKDKYAMNPYDAKVLAEPLEIHHQGKTFDTSNSIYWNCAEPWKQYQDILENEIQSVFKPSPLQSLQMKVNHNLDATLSMMAGLVILSDWLASAQWLSKMDIDYEHDESSESYGQRIYPVVVSIVKDCKLDGIDIGHTNDFHTLWTTIPEESIRPLQKVVESICLSDTIPLLSIMEAPMGEGKTEAGVLMALRMAEAYGKEGFYFALPTQATSNQMYERMSCLFNDHGWGSGRLLHGMSWIADNEGSEIDYHESDNFSNKEASGERAARAWMKPVQRGLLQQFAVGTVDQIMRSVLVEPYGILRLFCLLGKVVIIDEMHSYDEYMITIIEKLLVWCKALSIPVVILSATLTSSKRKAIIKSFLPGKDGAISVSNSYPLVTTISKEGKCQEIPVKGSYMQSAVHLSLVPELGNWESVGPLCLEEVAEGGVLCAIVNTVGDAQALFQQIAKQNTYPDLDLMLFHSRFTARDRKAIEEECVRKFGKGSASRPYRAILVATQVVEQSLDVDFDVMVSSLAPIDLLLQREGRLYRHRETIRPQKLHEPHLFILVPNDENGFGKNESIYAGIILQRTCNLLKSLKEIHLPADIRNLIESVYAFEGTKNSTEISYQYQLDLKRGKAKPEILPDPSTGMESTLVSTLLYRVHSSKTRDSLESIQVAFLNQGLSQKYVNGELGPKDAVEVYLSTIDLPSYMTPQKCHDGKEVGDIFSGLKFFTGGQNPMETKSGNMYRYNPVLGYVEVKEE